MSMIRTTLYLVRHGKTEWNTMGLMQGWGDSPLTEEGIRGAQAIRDALKTIPFAAAYTSSSQRAIDTARIIMEYHKNMPLETDEDLREIYFGKWEGLKYRQLAIEFPEEHRNLMLHADKYIPENSGGETYPAMLTRMERALKRIATKHKGSFVLIVSHGMSLSSIVKHLQGVPLKDLRIRGGALELTLAFINTNSNALALLALVLSDA
ncbi:unnamed protein product [Rotaria sp. Silwood1]|nr:unnamed protein product [Rotaria sp. Silwood1]